MTAATAAPPRGQAALAGTRTLIRFNLRRDRVRLPVWIGALFLGTYLSAVSLEATYPDAASRATASESLATAAGLAMSGPAHYLTDYTYGAMLGHQMVSFTAVLVGIMSVLTVVRHSRAEEETGRAELLRSSVVGRHAHLTAALGTAALANLALGVLLAGGLATLGGAGYTASGAVLYGAAHAAIGLVFAAVAAITAQVTAHSRGASGMALAVVGAAYAIRAAGDAAGSGQDGLSWLSPIGWVQRTYVYVDNRWWPLLLCLALTGVLTAAGFRLSTRRDVGAGLRPARVGRPSASAALGHPLGLALRLHRGVLTGFGCALLLLGAMYGSVLGNAEGFVDVEVLSEALEELGGSSLAENFASMVMIPLSVVAAVYAVMATGRARSEETSGRAEPLLATGLSRTRWLGSHLTIALAGSTAAMAAAGLSFGLTGAASTGDAALAWKIAGGALAYAPALWVTVGAATVLFGWLPRATVAAWALPAGAFVIGYLGVLLDFPRWVMNLNPFGHVPRLPAAELEWTPLLLLTGLAVLLTALGLAGFRRRDLELK